MSEKSINLAKVKSLEWLVDARNKIQSLMLRLYKLAQDPNANDVKKPENLHDLIGAAFSLWRAVFLVYANKPNYQKDPEDETKEVRVNLDDDAVKFLEKVIDTNAISFSDDRHYGSWTVGYYLNNARFRLGLEMVSRNELPEDCWDKTFSKLEETLQSVVSAKAKN